MKEWWSDPDNRERVRRTRVEASAKRRGVTVEALERPRTWAPAAERKDVYRELFRLGLTFDDIVREFPNEDLTIIHRCKHDVRIEEEYGVGPTAEDRRQFLIRDRREGRRLARERLRR